jgi:hypothetical protein
MEDINNYKYWHAQFHRFIAQEVRKLVAEFLKNRQTREQKSADPGNSQQLSW